jgi:hypothetical protein
MKSNEVAGADARMLAEVAFLDRVLGEVRIISTVPTTVVDLRPIEEWLRSQLPQAQVTRSCQPVKQRGSVHEFMTSQEVRSLMVKLQAPGRFSAKQPSLQKLWQCEPTQVARILHWGHYYGFLKYCGPRQGYRLTKELHNEEI